MTKTPLFPPPAPPAQFERVVGFRDHKAPPSTPEDMESEINDWVEWGWTDICMGITNVVGRGVRILKPKGIASEAGALVVWHEFAMRAVRRGIRVHASLWHKPDWHQDLLRMTVRFARRMNGLLSSVIWDIEGETLRHNVKFDHRTAGSDIAQMKQTLKTATSGSTVWGVTVQIGHMQRAPRRVRPYLEQAEWNLVQVLGFENAKRAMGLSNPSTLPGFFHEQAIDLLDSAYAWLKRTCHTTVLIAAYWQHIEGVDVDDVVGAACSSLLAAGRQDVGVFSDGWMRKEPEVVRELVRRSSTARVVEGAEAREVDAGTEEIVFTADEVALDQLGFDAATRPTMSNPMPRLSDYEARYVWESCRDGYAKHSWVFPSNDYELLLHEVRSTSRTPGSYDDLLYMIRRVDGEIEGWVVAYNCDPNPHYLKNPVRMAIRRKGTLIHSHPQQITGYVHAPHMGKLRGSLCQYRTTSPSDGWRDGNRDGVLDITGPDVRNDRGHFGRNSHPGGWRWGDVRSAGCGTYPRALMDAIEALYQDQTKHVGRKSFNQAITSEEEFAEWM